MDYREWEPYYREIVKDFGFDIEMDRKAGIILAEFLSQRAHVTRKELEDMISGKSVLIIGPKAYRIPMPLKDIIIATDSSTELCLRKGILPDIITTDLDGDVDYEIKANNMGSILLIHAHGDNIEEIRRHLPKITGMIGGTVQCEPFPPLMNFGGFTDGDRAVFLADAMGAKSISITGFDFRNPVEKDHKDMEIKLRKLGWAERLIGMLDVEYI